MLSIAHHLDRLLAGREPAPELWGLDQADRVVDAAVDRGAGVERVRHAAARRGGPAVRPWALTR